MALAEYTNVGVATLVISWSCTCLATISVVTQVWTKYGALDVGDFLTVAAFVIALGLVGQTPWAVVDEGQGRHAQEETHSQFELVGKVNRVQTHPISGLLTDLLTVTPH